ncbi:hypothetical protein Tco_0377917 [Tanacetum coccineum]
MWVWLSRLSSSSRISPISHPVWEVVSSCLFEAVHSAWELSALRLDFEVSESVELERMVVVGVGRCLCLSWHLVPGCQASECILYMVAGTLSGNGGACSNNVGQPPSKGSQMEYSMIVPQSETDV